MSVYATIKLDIEIASRSIVRGQPIHEAAIDDLRCSARSRADAIARLKQAIHELTRDPCPAPEIVVAADGAVFALYRMAPGQWGYSITRAGSPHRGGCVHPCVGSRNDARAEMERHVAAIAADAEVTP